MMCACSAVRAMRATMNISDVPAATTQSTSTPTSSGEPNETSKNSDPAVSRTLMATTPRS